MNEKEIKELLKQSVVTTSDHFTDDLIGKLQSEKKMTLNFYRVAGVIFVACVAILLLAMNITFPEISIYKVSIKTSPNLFPILSFGFIFYILNLLYTTYRNIKLSESEKIIEIDV